MLKKFNMCFIKITFVLYLLIITKLIIIIIIIIVTMLPFSWLLARNTPKGQNMYKYLLEVRAEFTDKK